MATAAPYRPQTARQGAGSPRYSGTDGSGRSGFLSLAVVPAGGCGQARPRGRNTVGRAFIILPLALMGAMHRLRWSCAIAVGRSARPAVGETVQMVRALSGWHAPDIEQRLCQGVAGRGMRPLSLRAPPPSDSASQRSGMASPGPCKADARQWPSSRPPKPGWGGFRCVPAFTW